ncbi:MAG: guanine deaminase [Sebaldella sp.]|nr:guanine deaminase [Sebaldella sp.]
MLKIYKGNIVFTSNPEKFNVIENGYIVVEDGKVKEVREDLNEGYKDIEIEDFGDKIIIPGFVDVHVHAPQFENLGLGFDKELLPWLETYTFPEESKFKETSYAKKVYTNFIRSLWEKGSTRSIVFATIHKEATEVLMELFKKSGLSAYVGKVNMDRNSPPFLIETVEDSLKDTEYLIEKYNNKDSLVKLIITPRFVPTCSGELMGGLSELSKKYDLPVQSHLSENFGEISWVHELHPDNKNYSDVYDSYGLFGTKPTIMAHCVHNNEDEIELMKKNNVFVAHCPTSNFNLSSGMAPIRKYMDMGINVGIGSDVSGGHTMSMRECIVAAIQTSKMYNVYVDKESKILSTSEAFYLATKGGGKFFGKVGSFEEGYEFDALILDDTSLKGVSKRTIDERVQRFVYSGNSTNIVRRYVAGKEVFKIEL